MTAHPFMLRPKHGAGYNLWDQQSQKLESLVPCTFAFTVKIFAHCLDTLASPVLFLKSTPCHNHWSRCQKSPPLWSVRNKEHFACEVGLKRNACTRYPDVKWQSAQRLKQQQYLDRSFQIMWSQPHINHSITRFDISQLIVKSPVPWWIFKNIVLKKLHYPCGNSRELCSNFVVLVGTRFRIYGDIQPKFYFSSWTEWVLIRCNTYLGEGLCSKYKYHIKTHMT